MNYVDLILKYLSGELSPEEVNSFREELTSNEGLKKEFEELSAAYELIRDQLAERDALAFKQKLRAAMDHDIPSSPDPKHPKQRWWLPLLAVAAGLTLVLVLLLKPGDRERMFSKHYAPDQDPVILALLQDTRGEQEEGILHFKNSRYGKAMISFEALVSAYPENKKILLLYLLSAMELDRESEMIQGVLNRELHFDRLPDQAVAWYAALALIKTGHPDEAGTMLESLSGKPGPYQSDAENLLKLLLK